MVHCFRFMLRFCLLAAVSSGVTAGSFRSFKIRRCDQSFSKVQTLDFQNIQQFLPENFFRSTPQLCSNKYAKVALQHLTYMIAASEILSFVAPAIEYLNRRVVDPAIEHLLSAIEYMFRRYENWLEEHKVGKSSSVDFEPHKKRREGETSGSGVVHAINLACIAVHMAWQLADDRYMWKNFVQSKNDLVEGKHTIILAAFSHENAEHLASNLLALNMVGPVIAKDMGTRLFSYFYIASIYASEMFNAFVYKRKFQPKRKFSLLRWIFSWGEGALGASGAIAALITFCSCASPSLPLMITQTNGIEIYVPSLVVGLIAVAGDIASRSDSSNVGYGAHFGGYIFGVGVWALRTIFTNQDLRRKIKNCFESLRLQSLPVEDADQKKGRR